MHMVKKKSFKTRVTIALSQEQVAFLEELVKRGETESVSQAIRKCINVVMKNVREG